MDVKGANEADIREEIAAPLLALLGYRRGSENAILREFPISYDRNFLGRKKKNDPTLRGRADYVLCVNGVGRWVLEVKSPSEDITQDDIEQAISYARHPEVSGTYTVILNGRRLLLFHNTQRSIDKPKIDIEVISPDDLSERLRGILSPDSFRRDCSPPKVDLGLPLSDGLRSSSKVIGGSISYSKFLWECNMSLPEDNKAELDETCRRLSSFRSIVTGGRVWRDDNSRIRTKLTWGQPHDLMLQFAQEKNLMDIEYVSLSETISTDPATPTVFDVVGGVNISKGETLFDIVRWDTKLAGIDTTMNFRGQALGYLEGANFSGQFQAVYESYSPAVPLFSINMYGMGTFELELDNK